MEMTKWMAPLAMTAALALTAGCSSSMKKHEAPPPPTPAQQAMSQLDSDRTAYVNETQSRIDKMNEFSGQLRARSAAAQKPQSKKLSNAADDMDSILNDVRKELADVKSADTANWIDEKRDVEKAMSRAETQYSNSVSLMQ